MHIAIVHDWLTVPSGAERVLECMLEVFPQADLYSIVDFLSPKDRFIIKEKKVKTSFIQKMPFAKKWYRHYLPLMPIAVEQFNLSNYDLIISSSHAVAKGVITGPHQIHLCMCYSPIRYAWDLTHQYLNESGLRNGIKGVFAKYILHKLRLWDLRTANGVDEFIAISKFIQNRINKIYRRPSTVIYPPVNVEEFTLCEKKQDFYLTASRFVPYKKIDIIVEAFRQMPEKKLVVIGDGPDFKKILATKPDNVDILGHQPFNVLKDKMQKAKAFIFAAIEDFGIVPIEAQACGTPVIALARGALCETINDKTGCFFYEQTPSAITQAICEFEAKSFNMNPHECRNNAMRFSKEQFKKDFYDFVTKQISNYESTSTCRR